MNKKAFAFWFLIELIAGIVAAYLLISVAVSWGKGTIFLETKLARDIAIEINTLHAVPGNVYLQYPQNLSNYIIEFRDNKVEVYQEGDAVKPSYEYLDSLYYLKESKISFKEFEGFGEGRGGGGAGGRYEEVPKEKYDLFIEKKDPWSYLEFYKYKNKIYFEENE